MKFEHLFRVNALTKEELDSNSLVSLENINDGIVSKIETSINLLFFKEMLEKFLQLIQNGWVNKTDTGNYIDFYYQYSVSERPLIPVRPFPT